jgi:hypothetical protein
LVDLSAHFDHNFQRLVKVDVLAECLGQLLDVLELLVFEVEAEFW